jgi:hypothetical protein
MSCEERLKVSEKHPKTSPEEPQHALSEESKEAAAQVEWRKVTKAILTLLFCVFMFLTGCATVTTGKYQTIPVTSEPPGINVMSSAGVSITTPGSFKLIRNKDYTLFAEYSGCKPQQKELKHKLQDSFWTNALIWGVTSSAIDLASGASDELVPKKVHFDFTSAGQAAASRQQS